MTKIVGKCNFCTLGEEGNRRVVETENEIYRCAMLDLGNGCIIPEIYSISIKALKRSRYTTGFMPLVK